MAMAGPVEITLAPCGVAVVESVHAPDFFMAPSVDPFHEVIHVLHGHIALVVGNENTNVRMPQGSYGVVAAGTRHQIVDVAASTVLLLCASDEVMSRSSDRRYVWDRLATELPSIAVPRTQYERERLHSHWRRLLGLQDQKESPVSRLRVLTEFDECLLALYDLLTSRSGNDTGTRMRAAISVVVERSSEHWSVAKAARHAGLSERRFSQLFRETTGTTFVPWLQELRINHACRMLATGRHTIASAAFSCGFEDLSHFYHVFQRLCGRTPRQWVLDNDDT